MNKEIKEVLNLIIDNVEKSIINENTKGLLVWDQKYWVRLTCLQHNLAG